MNSMQNYETQTLSANVTRPAVKSEATTANYIPSLSINIELATFANRDRGRASSDAEIVQEALEMFAEYMIDRVQEAGKDGDTETLAAWCEYLSRINNIQGQIITALVKADQERSNQSKNNQR